MYRSSDIDYNLNKHLAIVVALKYHLKPLEYISVKIMQDLNRDLPVRYRIKDMPYCKDVLRDLYILWIKLECSEARPDAPWMWEIYHDVKDSARKVA